MKHEESTMFTPKYVLVKHKFGTRQLEELVAESNEESMNIN
jgi:hypothetical protein